MAKQTRSVRTRLHLVRSAAELFDRNGFAGTTLADVARAAGVTKGAFYFHFSCKDELAGAVQSRARTLLRAAVRAATADRADDNPDDNDDTDRGGAVQSVVDLTHTLASWLEHEPLVRASFRIARECQPFPDFYLDLRAVFETLLLIADRAGDLRPGVGVEDAVTLVLAVVAGMELLWWAGVRTGSVGAGLTGMWSLALPGLVARARLRRIDPAGSHLLG